MRHRKEKQAPGAHSRKRALMGSLFRFFRDQDGATAIEYGLIAAGISIAIIATVQALGTSVQTALK
jgi:pilus assembly protein Flp/PilA